MESFQKISTYSPLLYFLLFITALIICALFTNLSRQKMIVRQQNCDSKIVQKHATVILPICGGYNEAIQFAVWNSMLYQKYNGEIDYLFVVESKEDPAYQCFTNFVQSQKFDLQQIEQYQQCRNNQKHQFKLLFSGLTFHNAQKVHNMLHAVDNSRLKTDYVIFIDDDIEINDHTVYNLVNSLENDATGKIKISTGYSVEIPQVHNIVNYLVMVYRSFNLLGFCQENVNYCWGGCFCLKYQDFVDSKIREIYIDGGYSDDMTIGNLFKQDHFKIIAPKQNMFINRITCTKFKSQYYNYVQRQYFVLNTYFGKKDKIVNKIALIQLLFGGVITMLFVILIGADLLYEAINKNLISVSSSYKLNIFQIKCAFVVLCLYIIGASINNACITLEHLVNRLMNKSDKRTSQLNNLLTAIALIVHFLCTPIMIIQLFLKNKIQWGSCIYEVLDGKVSYVERVDIQKYSKFQTSKKQSLMMNYGICKNQFEIGEVDIKQKYE